LVPSGIRLPLEQGKGKDRFMVKERGLLMKGPLVIKTINGLKTETRRVIRPAWSRCLDLDDPEDAASAVAHNPYGQPGDILYLRETWKHDFIHNHVDYTAVGISYRAGEWGINMDLRNRKDRDRAIRGMERGDVWRPGIHMPRAYARVFVEVQDVSLERVQCITEADAKAEGVVPFTQGFPEWPEQRLCTGERCFDQPYRAGFAVLWDEINERRGYGWFENPHVFVVRYKLVEYRAPALV
jgi:hypothetical protein